MSQSRSRKLLGAGIALASLTVLGCATSSADTMTYDPNLPVMKSADQIEWQAVNPAISMGAAFGNRAEGAHGTFGTFPPNFITPVHKHSHAYHAVVLWGTMTNPMGVNGEKNPTKMGPGGYWYVPAGAPHATACVSSTPCEFYFHMVEPFDFQVIETEEK